MVLSEKYFYFFIPHKYSSFWNLRNELNYKLKDLQLECVLQDPQNTSLFGKCFKKLVNIFSNFFFYLKVQSWRLIMENNFIQMAASADHTVSTIFKYIIDCVQLYFTNGFSMYACFIWKDDFFFAKIGIFCKSIAGPLSEAKTLWMINWLQILNQLNFVRVGRHTKVCMQNSSH